MTPTAQAPTPARNSEFAPAIATAAYALEMLQISKLYPGVQALDSVDLQVQPGEIHALVGENGAGKSTLMKVLFGAVQKDSGTIRIKGSPVEIGSPADAARYGISMVHQELNLVPQMSAAQNIFLGREKTLDPFGQITRKGAMREAAAALMAQLGTEVDVTLPVRRLSIAKRQMIEIAKALSTQAEILVMDEPTSSLTDREIAELFASLRTLTTRGVSVIFVSHRMEEIFDICTRVTVLRDGKTIGTRPIAGLRTEDVIGMMVGRDLSSMYHKRAVPPGEEVIRCENISLAGILHDVSLTGRAGEIIGIAGLVGAGRTEFSEVLFGARQADSGAIYFQGERIRLRTPQDAIQRGIGLLTADRKGQGLVLGLPITVNISLARLDKLSPGGIIQRGEQARVAREYVDSLHIRPGDHRRRARFLSGGNQQKVVLAKWLFSNVRLLIFNEPTRGIDVGAKAEIYQLMNDLVAQGKCILMISSELPEVIGMSDRILVMREGRFVQTFVRKRADDARSTIGGQPADGQTADGQTVAGAGWPEDIKAQILHHAMGEGAADADPVQPAPSEKEKRVPQNDSPEDNVPEVHP